MGTTGDPNNETRYFSQQDQLWMEARMAERQEDDARRRWRSIILSVAICMIAVSVMVMAVWFRL